MTAWVEVWRASFSRLSMVGGSHGHEEAGVETLGGEFRGDPVADVVDGLGRQHETLGAAHVEEPRAALVDLQTVGLEPGPLGRVGGVEHVRPRGGIEGLGQKDPGLLEALTQGGHPESQPT
jgi:hypothetical protein